MTPRNRARSGGRGCDEQGVQGEREPRSQHSATLRGERSPERSLHSQPSGSSPPHATTRPASGNCCMRTAGLAIAVRAGTDAAEARCEELRWAEVAARSDAGFWKRHFKSCRRKLDAAVEETKKLRREVRAGAPGLHREVARLRKELSQALAEPSAAATRTRQIMIKSLSRENVSGASAPLMEVFKSSISILPSEFKPDNRICSVRPWTGRRTRVAGVRGGGYRLAVRAGLRLSIRRLEDSTA